MTAILDDRLPRQKYVRLLAVGLHPGPGELYCSYDCPDAEGKRCSTTLKAVILLAGTKEDYVPCEYPRNYAHEEYKLYPMRCDLHMNFTSPSAS